ncbi:MAG: helix-turn-helix transcriptional regulator [Clostridia bacterium]|nr:helix-turn-helix transcriptional regulator [Clostridia bacterium]
MKNKLKEARENAGLTQKQVADAVGITIRCYQYYETGIKKPAVDVAIQIAKKLNSTVEEVFTV